MAQGSPPRPLGTIHISLITLIIEIPRPIHIWCVKTSAVLMSSPVQIKALSAISGFGGITSNPYHRILEGVTFHIYSSLKRSAHTCAYPCQNRCSFNDFTCSEKSLSANPDLKIKCKGNCLKVNWSGAKLIAVTPSHYIIFNNFSATHTLIIGFVIFSPPFLSHSGRRHSISIRHSSDVNVGNWDGWSLQHVSIGQFCASMM